VKSDRKTIQGEGSDGMEYALFTGTVIFCIMLGFVIHDKIVERKEQKEKKKQG
jgi:hypothetical protein